MSRSLPLAAKVAAFITLGLPLAMVLLRTLWPDISWGFLLLFGLQVLLLLTTVQLLATSIWGPASRWELPGKAAKLPRRIFAKKWSVMASLRGLTQSLQSRMKVPTLRLFKRKAL